MPSRLPPLSIEGPPLTDPKLWQLKVDGPAERPKTYSMGDIRAFEPANGGQLRPVAPFKLAYKPVKWLRRIANEMELGYRETRGYPPEAGIPGRTKIKYGME